MNHKSKKLIYNIVALTSLSLALIWICSRFVHIGNVEFTDNAQVKQLIVPVNSRVQGFVSGIYFDEYSEVKKGDTLMVIEDIEYRVRVAQAEADYQNALVGKSAMKTTINTTHNNILVMDAGVDEVKARLDNAKSEYDRYSKLYEQKAVTKQQFDAVLTNYNAMKARYELQVRQKNSTSLVKQEQTERLDQTEAGIKLAEAALELARLNLSYTVITAPCNGTTGRKNIREGQLIQPGQTIIEIVDNNERWIVANYKEKQIANIKEGNEVEMEIDAIPNQTFKGNVKSISRATGAIFSLITHNKTACNLLKLKQ